MLASNGDAIGLQLSTNIWVDHCELYSDARTDKGLMMVSLTSPMQRTGSQFQTHISTTTGKSLSSATTTTMEPKTQVISVSLYTTTTGLTSGAELPA